MIIVSQDHKRYINLNNTSEIYLDDSNGVTVLVRYKACDGHYSNIAEYSSIEIAKDVIMALLVSYTNYIQADNYMFNPPKMFIFPEE